MTQAMELIRTIEQRGGKIRVEGGNLKVAPREIADCIMDQLREWKPQIIAILQSEAGDDLHELRGPFVAWMNSSCVIGQRFAGNLRGLHVDFCEWLDAREMATCPAAMFADLARELGCIVGELPTGETLVVGLALREGLEEYTRKKATKGRATA